ncbi:hypothetical protein [Bacillus thuringiensis]|uniref:hypothetical protein n=1 Tax=Bacillus thuringiensis TaxID=1428 RepID=UPI0024BC144B|nr:hypothetical protein [Bacillus thuringiensis]
MVMFVLHMDDTPFFNFNIPNQKFKKGEIITNAHLDGSYIVVHCDPATVTVKPFMSVI